MKCVRKLSIALRSLLDPMEADRGLRSRWPEWLKACINYWHPSICWSFFLNICRMPVSFYRDSYYRPCWYMGSLCFHLVRRFIQISFAIFVLIFYLNPGHQVLILIITLLFFLVLLDNLLSQLASQTTFLHLSDPTVLAILADMPFVRKELNIYKDKLSINVSNNSKMPKEPISFGTIDDPDLNELVGEIVQGISKNTLRIRSSILRIMLLPIRHVFAIIIIFALITMALEITWYGEAFRGLIFENPSSRNLRTFVEDLTETFYFAGVTVATVGYGDVTPKVANERKGGEDSGKRLPSTMPVRFFMLMMIFAIIITILTAFSIVFQAIQGLLSNLKNKDHLARIIIEFVNDDVHHYVIS
jgi:ABC-type multidrug transport system fused ATPase/permease subunit